jgi:hypothetical protein
VRYISAVNEDSVEMVPNTSAGSKSDREQIHSEISKTLLQESESFGK